MKTFSLFFLRGPAQVLPHWKFLVRRFGRSVQNFLMVVEEESRGGGGCYKHVAPTELGI